MRAAPAGVCGQAVDATFSPGDRLSIVSWHLLWPSARGTCGKKSPE